MIASIWALSIPVGINGDLVTVGLSIPSLVNKKAGHVSANMKVAMRAMSAIVRKRESFLCAFEYQKRGFFLAGSACAALSLA